MTFHEFLTINIRSPGFAARYPTSTIIREVAGKILAWHKEWDVSPSYEPDCMEDMRYILDECTQDEKRGVSQLMCLWRHLRQYPPTYVAYNRRRPTGGWPGFRNSPGSPQSPIRRYKELKQQGVYIPYSEYVKMTPDQVTRLLAMPKRK